MVTATLFMVASANIIRKRDLFLGVDVAAETAFLEARRATVSAFDPVIGLENESMVIHSINMRFVWCSFCSFRSLLDKTAGTAESAKA